MTLTSEFQSQITAAQNSHYNQTHVVMGRRSLAFSAHLTLQIEMGGGFCIMATI